MPNIDYDSVKKYRIVLKGGSGMTSIRTIGVESAFADAADLAILLSKQNNCDADMFDDCGYVVRLGEEDARTFQPAERQEPVATFRRCVWAMYGNADGQAILDNEKE